MTIRESLQTYSDFLIEGEDLPFPVHRKNFKKHEVVTGMGETEGRVYFIVSGIVEIDIFKDGDNRIIDFYFPNSFFCALTSFLRQEPSEAEIIALTDLEAEYLEYNDVQMAYKDSVLANQLGRLLIEQAYLVKFQREKDFLTKTADVRYLELMRDRPELLKVLPVHKIAEYLGIHPESLSRIRKSIIS